MREAEEREIWKKLTEEFRLGPLVAPIEASDDLQVDSACMVLGGLNGSGKTRLLLGLEAAAGEEAILIDLPHLCEQIKAIIRSREDAEEMTEELSSAGPSSDRLDDLHRVLRRRYDSVEWFGLEIEPYDAAVAARLIWSNDQSVVPFFRAQHQGRTYTSLDMGLGEFSIHLLFWILEQYRDRRGMTLLLDEPDAFLPPVGVQRLMARLQGICVERGWRLVIASHSEEMIAAAVAQSALILVKRASNGGIVAQPAASADDVGDHLLTPASIDKVIFCEDESAWYLIRALLTSGSIGLARTTAVTWGRGEGYLRTLVKTIPKPPNPQVKFAVAPDGDQRDKFVERGVWPVWFLPTSEDPDDLFRTLGGNPERLAVLLGTTTSELTTFFESLEGDDSHDWVNSVGERYGRAHALTVLAREWVFVHSDIASACVSELFRGWK